MNTQSIGNNRDSWTQFLRLANQARSRNAGFELPLTPQRTVSGSGTRKSFEDVIAGGQRAGKIYEKDHASPKQRSVLGTRFDAYA
jgi:hypothetical protein